MFAFPPLQLIHPLLEPVKQEDLSLILVPRRAISSEVSITSGVMAGLSQTGFTFTSARVGIVHHPPYVEVLASDWLILQGRTLPQRLAECLSAFLFRPLCGEEECVLYVV